MREEERKERGGQEGEGKVKEGKGGRERRN
jgi:hypothetical protein